MNEKRERIPSNFKKAVDEFNKKLKDETLKFEDFVTLLGFCDNLRKLNDGYPQKHTFYCFYDCRLFGQRFLSKNERTQLHGMYKEKEYSLMTPFQKELEDTMRDPAKKKNFFDSVEQILAVRQSKNKLKH